MAEHLRVVVAGMIAGDPGHGGATWATLQWVLGLAELGHRVTVVDPVDGKRLDDPRVRTYFDAVVDRFALGGRAAIVAPHGATYGIDAAPLAVRLDEADVLINLSGRWRDPRLHAIPLRVYVDLDPAFTQLWHAEGSDVGLAGHTHHATVGAAVAQPRHPLRVDGIDWLAILPPVVLSLWPRRPAPPTATLSTVANWRSYGSITRDGEHYGQKAHSFRTLADVPRKSAVPIEIALSIHPGDHADHDALHGAGWKLVDPGRAAGDPDRYADFVAASWAEFGVAKSGYVTGRTGWVSDRTACYLATGRPAVLQNTGLDGVLPIGSGVLTFDDVDGAIDAIERLAADYDHHADAAAGIALELLDSRKVIAALLAEVTT